MTVFTRLKAPDVTVQSIRTDVIATYSTESKWAKVANDVTFWAPFISAEKEYADLGTDFYKASNENLDKNRLEGGNYFFNNRIGDLRSKLFKPYKTKGLCAVCGQSVVRHLDHVLPRTEFPRLMLVPNNLVPLCATCNENKKDKWGGLNTPVYNHYLEEVIFNTSDYRLTFISNGEFEINVHYHGTDIRQIENFYEIYKLNETFNADAVRLMMNMVEVFSSDVGEQNRANEDRSVRGNILDYANSALNQGFEKNMFPEISEIFYRSVINEIDSLVDNWHEILDVLS